MDIEKQKKLQQILNMKSDTQKKIGQKVIVQKSTNWLRNTTNLNCPKS